MYCWLTHGDLCDPPKIFLPRPSLTHCQPTHAGWWCRQHNILHSISTLFHICHMFSVWTCSHLWREQGANGGPADYGVLWQMPIKLHSAVLWAQIPLQDIRSSFHPHGVCFWQFGQSHAHQSPAGGHSVGLWQCSSCSSSHMEQISVLMQVCCPSISLSFSPHVSPPSIFSMLLRLCWETHQTLYGMYDVPSWRIWTIFVTWLCCRCCLMIQGVRRTLKTRLETNQSG